MANHVNHRRKILRDPRFRASDSYCKGANQSRKYEKQEWNQHVRRDGRRLCAELLTLYKAVTHSLVAFRGYPRREVVVYNLRPWMD